MPTPAIDRTLTFLERFRIFHRNNPQVYAELVRLCREGKATGRRHLGIRTLWEVMRWNLANVHVATNDPTSDLKLNDHYHTYYARLIMEQEPDLAGFFELRTLRSAGR